MDSRNPFDRTIRRIRLLPNLAKQLGRCPLHHLSQRRHHAVQGKPANGRRHLDLPRHLRLQCRQEQRMPRCSEQPLIQSRQSHHRRRREDWRRYGEHCPLHLRRRCHREPEKLRHPQPHKRTQRSQLSIVNGQWSIQRGSQRLSPLLRSCPLLAAMGRHTG